MRDEFECEDCRYCNLNRYYHGEWYCRNPEVSIFDLPVDPEKCFEEKKKEKEGAQNER